MDRARELALRGIDSAVVSADRQSSGKGRSGRTWISRQGGLFFTFLERPRLAVADYNLHSIIMQIALVRTVSSVCGKQAYLRWPNDVYINKRKIAGVITEISGEGDLIKWISLGVGLNINNHIPSGKAASCAEITGRNLSRRDILISLLEEAEKIKKTFSTSAVYSQGSHALANEWNSLSDCLGAKAVVFEPDEAVQTGNASVHKSKPEKILARGIFEGIDPIGRCILKTKDGKLFFNQGSVSLAFLNPD
jgi:BirA family biotin operon repressor/biotin-[acetyl-CoA-carboxylase] ligase